MSCIYGPRQMGTEDQGWLAHFLISALDGRPISIYGDGRQVRDVLFVDDAVEAYVRAAARIGAVSGQAFNLGGGPANAVTLLDVLGAIDGGHGRAAGRAVRRLAAGRPALFRGRYPPYPRGSGPAGRCRVAGRAWAGWRAG